MIRSAFDRGSPHHIKHIPALSLLLSSLVIFFLFQYVKELFFRLFYDAYRYTHPRRRGE